MTPQVRAAGESAVVIEFGVTIDPDIVARVQRLDAAVTSAAAAGRLPGVLETVPTFRSLAIVLDPLRTTPDDVASAALALDDASPPAARDGAGHRWVLPVRYGGDAGPDLTEVASTAGLAPDEVVRRHVDRPVTVFMLGFLPGFGFMGETDPSLRLPRRREPRIRVPAGSVAIAMSLTAVYPWESPGGWHLIGHSPVPLFDATSRSPTLLAPGDEVRFRAIDADEHAALVDRQRSGCIEPDEFLATHSATTADDRSR